ncbi:MAG: ACT domain-containing protein [Firmicutes bacterium]|jgi:hypothetical protein|nr:ACT domain-containing protein [Bacillota bacterium]
MVPGLKVLPYDLTVCKTESVSDIDFSSDFFFAGKTDEEISLVCKTEDAPEKTTEREDGWRCFRIEGQLDFSLTGILSRISAVLADAGIGIFAVSTYNTDYVLVKARDLDRSVSSLKEAGYVFAE